MRIAIVTAADAGYSHLAMDLIQSVTAHAPFEFRMFCMDVGLDEASKALLSGGGAEIVQVGWDYPGHFPGEWFKALSARPHIPRYIRGFDLYIWLDADCWVQEGLGLQDLVEAALKNSVAAISSIYPGYRQIVSEAPNSRGLTYPQFYYYLFSQLLEPVAAAALFQRPYLNCGVFAAQADSPLWPSWQKLLGVLYPRGRMARRPDWKKTSFPDWKKTSFVERSSWQKLLRVLYPRGSMATTPASKRKPPPRKSNGIWTGLGVNQALFHSEEVAFNVVSHLQVGNPAILSARCNWLCSQAIPMLDDQGFFVDTTWPHERIGVVHMAAHTKEGSWEARTMDGRSVVTSLRMRINGSPEESEDHGL
jgi:hypothetical protein